jgi:hypothetical protein
MIWAPPRRSYDIAASRADLTDRSYTDLPVGNDCGELLHCCPGTTFHGYPRNPTGMRACPPSDVLGAVFATSNHEGIIGDFLHTTTDPSCR